MWCAIYLACLLIMGFGAAAGLAGPKPLLERIGWAACLGPAIAGLCMIGVSLAGLAPSRIEIGLLAAAFGAVGIWAISKRNSPPTAIPPPVESAPIWWMVICLIAIGYGIFAVTTDALGHPLTEWDAYSIWELKAKVLAAHPMLPRPAFFTDLTLSFAHLRYPLLIPMIGAGLHAMTGRIDDGLEQIPLLLMYLGLGICIFAFVSEKRGTSLALAATTLLMTTQVMLNYAGAGMADLPLAALYGCSLICILRWQESGKWNDLALASLLGGCIVWTKNEGSALALINVAAIFALTPRPAEKRNLRAAAASALVVALIALPWFLYQIGLPHTDENYSERLTPAGLAENVSRLPLIFEGFGVVSTDWRLWGLFWIVVPVTAILGWKQLATRPIVTLWIMLILHLLAYVPPYMVTNWNLHVLLWASLSRLMLHATPAAALLVALQCPDLNLPGFRLRAPEIRHPQ